MGRGTWFPHHLPLPYSLAPAPRGISELGLSTSSCFIWAASSQHWQGTKMLYTYVWVPESEGVGCLEP